MWRGACLVACLLLAPSAAANVSLSVKEAPTEALAPGSDTAIVTLTVALDCADWIAAGGPSSPIMTGQISVVDGDPAVLWEGTTSISIDGSGCTPAAPILVDHEMHVQLARDAPGLQELDSTLQVALDAKGAYAGDTDTAVVTLLADYAPQLQLIAEQQIQSTSGLGVDYNITAANLGNAGTRVTLATVEAEGLDVSMPGTLTLAVNRSQVFTITLTPTDVKKGWNNDQFTFQMEATPEAMVDSSKVGAPTKLSLVLGLRGFGDGENASPGLGPFALLALLGVAIRARRRRE